MAQTRGETLSYGISFALIRAKKVMRGLKQALTSQERCAVADRAVEEMKKRGDPWRLNEDEAPGSGPGAPASQMRPKE